jgi:tRNA-dihydrouridine synthase
MQLHLGSMENITCWAFRSLFSGATDSYSGILAMSYLNERHKAWKEADFFPIKGQKQWLQVSTSSEEQCKYFLKRTEEEFNETPEQSNIYGIQLNCSCPSPYVIKIGQGPCLIKRPAKVASLLRALLKQDKYKVSIKTRLGFDDREVREGRIFKLFAELEKIKAENENFTQVAVHFKHAKSPSSSSYNYSFLPELLDYNIPVVINGGINSLNNFNRIVSHQSLNQKQKNNIAGFMMAREALVNPDCFIEPSNLLNKTSFSSRTSEQIKKEFEEKCKIHEPRELYMNAIKKYCKWAN